VRIALASLLTVLVSLAAFVAITRSVIGGSLERLITTTYRLHLDQAVAAHDRGGKAELAIFLAALNEGYKLRHRVTDSSGRDLLSGQELGPIIPPLAPGTAGRRSVTGRDAFVRVSADGGYRLVISGEPMFTMWSFAPFYLLVLGAVTVVSWWVAVGIASPLRLLAAATDRFGRGDLSARVGYRGRNEIGVVARSFNQMAERIQTLVTAERRRCRTSHMNSDRRWHDSTWPPNWPAPRRIGKQRSTGSSGISIDWAAWSCS
jgi:two-component system sensor histidine kinase CpxA